jgi:hypothetical protein
MGCGCKKNKTEQPVQSPKLTTEELQNQIKVVVNKYNKLKK